MKRSLIIVIIVGVMALLTLGIWTLKMKAPAPEAPLGNIISLRLRDVKSVDGFTLELVTINDSRCQPGVVCIWEGEIGATLQYKNSGVKEGYLEFLNVGMRTKPLLRLPYSQYQVQILESSTINQIDLMVSKFEINTFFDCADAGYPLTFNDISAHCDTPDGRIMSVMLSNANEKDGLIKVTSPAPGDYLPAPQKSATGEARGTWYFEASFPVQLTDGTGNVLCSAPAQAQGEWMTEEFVPFSVVLPCNEVTVPAYGYLVFKKDNPSGLPEYEDELRMLIKLRADASEL